MLIKLIAVFYDVLGWCGYGIWLRLAAVGVDNNILKFQSSHSIFELTHLGLHYSTPRHVITNADDANAEDTVE